MQEKDYGSFQQAIVLFEKQTWAYYTVPVNREEKGYDVEKVDIQYKCILRIDLWLVIFHFRWLTKIKEKNI